MYENDKTILIVDDVETNINTLMDLLDDRYDLLASIDGDSALEIINEEKVDLVLLDIMMPGIDGFEVCKKLKANDKTKDIPIIFITAKTDDSSIEKAYEVGGVDYITKPFRAREVISRIANHLTLSEHQHYLEHMVDERTKELQLLNKEIEDTQKEIVFTMGIIAEGRSKETANHVKRVAEYSYLLSKLYGLSEKEALLVKEANPMHDIGKVAIPDSIIEKPAKLTDEEFKIMKTHSQIGYEMLKHSNRPLLKAASIIAYEHHERYNGKGYPRGLKGNEIHIYGAITSICDVFDALGSDRVYKKAWSDEKIINLFIEETGEHFHPILANLFLANYDKFVKIREKYQDNLIKTKELEVA